MPIIVKCSSCGFILYKSNQPKPIESILMQWDFRCPCCMSPLSLDEMQFKCEARALKSLPRSPGLCIDAIKSRPEEHVLKDILDIFIREKEVTLSKICKQLCLNYGYYIETMSNELRNIIFLFIEKLLNDGIIDRKAIKRENRNPITYYVIKDVNKFRQLYLDLLKKVQSK